MAKRLALKKSSATSNDSTESRRQLDALLGHRIPRLDSERATSAQSTLFQNFKSSTSRGGRCKPTTKETTSTPAGVNRPPSFPALWVAAQDSRVGPLPAGENLLLAKNTGSPSRHIGIFTDSEASSTPETVPPLPKPDLNYFTRRPLVVPEWMFGSISPIAAAKPPTLLDIDNEKTPTDKNMDTDNVAGRFSGSSYHHSIQSSRQLRASASTTQATSTVNSVQSSSGVAVSEAVKLGSESVRQIVSDVQVETPDDDSVVDLTELEDDCFEYDFTGINIDDFDDCVEVEQTSGTVSSSVKGNFNVQSVSSFPTTTKRSDSAGPNEPVLPRNKERHSSLEMEHSDLAECPMCGIAFKVGMSKRVVDSHIQECLSDVICLD